PCASPTTRSAPWCSVMLRTGAALRPGAGLGGPPEVRAVQPDDAASWRDTAALRGPDDEVRAVVQRHAANGRGAAAWRGPRRPSPGTHGGGGPGRTGEAAAAT